MKFNLDIMIDAPVKKVVKLFDNPDNLKKWQPELVSFEHMSGKPGEPGAKSKLMYKIGSQTSELIETITVRNLPKEFSGTYKTKGMTNTMKNSFVAVGSKTKYIVEVEYTIDSFLLKVMAFLMPHKFSPKRYMQLFKEFVESR